MRRVLVVDDEKLIRQGITAMLQRAKTPIEEILQARDGMMALEILQSTEIDLLITDIRMPNLDGMELVSFCEKLKMPPLVVVISGYDDFSYAVEMLRRGVQDYLLKPIDREKLYATVARMEEISQKRQQEGVLQKERENLALLHIMLSQNPKEQDCIHMIQVSPNFFADEPYTLFCTREKKLKQESEFAIQEFEDRVIYLIFGKARREMILKQLKDGKQIVGVSCTHRGLDQIHKAYLQALEQWKISFFSGRLETFCMSNASDENQVKVDSLLQLISASRWQEVVRILKQQGQLVAAKALSPESFVQLCSEFIRKLNHVFQGILQDAAEMQSFSHVWGYDDFSHYIRDLESWLIAYGERVQQECADYENKKKIWEAVQYIRENYRAPLNMAIVSNQVCMNYSLFSLLFKQYTGVNFVGYLQNIRIEEAKRLLEETELKAYEIAAKCGFQDDKHFLKVFKSAVGISTTEWRKLHSRTL